MKCTNPYLSFDGKAAEAFAYYQSIFGGDISTMLIKETPMADQMPPGMEDKIMHAQLKSGNFLLMGSDMQPGPPVRGNMSGICIQCESIDEISKLYEALSPGSKINCPLGPQFWGDTFASLVDKYGVGWLLIYSTNSY